MSPNVRSLVLVGLVLGVTCAGIVWWLERFELQKVRQEIRDTLAGEAESYLQVQDAFRDWLREHGRSD